MTEKEKMLSGLLYKVDKELDDAHILPKKLLKNFNNEDNKTKREIILAKLLGSLGNNCYIEPPFYCEYGSNIFVGDNFYANMDCLFLDVCRIYIGKNVMLGPRVSLYTAAHPIDYEVRNELLEYGNEIIIGNNVWIGGSVVINPGVTIGCNSIIGSGSVVTKDIPANVIAVGNPCKVMRLINDNDKQYWTKLRNEYYNI